MASDPRYVEFDEMFAVMLWDKHDEVQVVATTRDLAERYIAGQWSNEGYSIQPIKVIRLLPEPRTLYMIHARLKYDPSSEPTPIVDEYTEFPGIGNGEMVPLDAVSSKVSEYVPFGWDVNAVAWSLTQAQDAFGERMAEARQLRDARREAFSQFTPGCVVRTETGDTMIRTATRDGVPCWNSASRVIHDADVDPATLTVIATGTN
ncbi:hypothetical protein AB0L65_32960 [Nonomuraea sp. NPDC052116]|uniref:hypothetical protein n=1 Tax=Nonomuraea sp. NPDC052116 TaxID=3155665 RepID=UPI00343AA482